MPSFAFAKQLLFWFLHSLQVMLVNGYKRRSLIFSPPFFQLYEESQLENERLREKLKKTEEELKDAKSHQDGVTLVSNQISYGLCCRFYRAVSHLVFFTSWRNLRSSSCVRHSYFLSIYSVDTPIF